MARCHLKASLWEPYFLKTIWVTMSDRIGVIMAEDKSVDSRLSIRVPFEVKEKIKREANKVGLSQSDIVRMIIAAYFEEKESLGDNDDK